MLPRSATVILLLTFYFLSGCSTLQTKSGEPSHVGDPYSGVRQAGESFANGPKKPDTNYGPNGPIGVGALFIPIGEFFRGTGFYLYTTVDLIGSAAGDTLFLPFDLIYVDDFKTAQALEHRDIQTLTQYYQDGTLTEPPLISAIARGDHQRIDALLRNDPGTVGIADPLGYTPLFHAAVAGDAKSLDAILASGGSLAPYYAAVALIYMGDTPTLNTLFERLPPDPDQIAPKGAFHGSNLLTAALRAERPALAERLIRSGAVNLDHEDTDGISPLILTIRAGDLNLTALLLKSGASAKNDRISEAAIYQEDPAFFNLLTPYGITLPADAIAQAVDRDDLNLTRRLISMGADLNVRKKYMSEYTALHLAAFRNNPDMIRLLVQSGMDVNIRNERGGTPLWKAVDSRRVEAVRTLLELGADPEIPFISASSGPITPLQRALRPIPDYETDPDAAEKRRAVIALLLPQSTTTYATLVRAVQADDVDTVSLLIDRGIKPNPGIAIYYAEDPAVRDLLARYGADARDRERFVKCVADWKRMFANVYYSGTPEENCEYHCQEHTDGRCP